ncbi:hypothetical protein Tco_1184295 [Tanacetum coccineum]
MEESKCDRYSLDVQRRSRDSTVVLEMFTGNKNRLILTKHDAHPTDGLNMVKLKQARVCDKELLEHAKEDNRKQYEEKFKSVALTIKEEMVKVANAKIHEMFAQYTHQPLISRP